MIARALMALLVLPALAFGAPVTSSITGTVADGEEVVVAGSGFGPGGTILWWDTFDTHDGGDYISRGTSYRLSPEVGVGTWGYWIIQPIGTPVLPDPYSTVSKLEAYSDSQAARIPVVQSGWRTSTNRIDMNLDENSPHRSFYVTFLRKIVGAGARWESGGHNHKCAGMGGDACQGNFPTLIFGSCNDGGYWQFYDNSGGGEDDPDAFNITVGSNPTYDLQPFPYDWDATKDEWQRWAAFSAVGNPVETRNDTVQLWIDWQEVYEGVGVQMRASQYEITDDCMYSRASFGAVTEEGSVDFDSLVVYIDDVMVADTRARVEFGDEPVLADCSVLDIQPFSAWADDEITLDLHLPSFAADDTAYVFVIDQDGNSSSGTMVVVGGAGPSVQVPVASFTAAPLEGETDTVIQFTDSSSNEPTAWWWDFGDSSGNSAEQDPAYTYTSADTYTPTLIVANAAGNDTLTRVDYITISETVTAPVAEFSADSTSGVAPFTVNFTDESTNDPTSWIWAFGDGDSSLAQNPTHGYDTAGTYTVSLQATNEGGSSTETKDNYISVQAAPEPTVGAVEPGLPSAGRPQIGGLAGGGAGLGGGLAGLAALGGSGENILNYTTDYLGLACGFWYIDEDEAIVMNNLAEDPLGGMRAERVISRSGTADVVGYSENFRLDARDYVLYTYIRRASTTDSTRISLYSVAEDAPHSIVIEWGTPSIAVESNVDDSGISLVGDFGGNWYLAWLTVDLSAYPDEVGEYMRVNYWPWCSNTSAFRGVYLHGMTLSRGSEPGEVVVKECDDTPPEFVSLSSEYWEAAEQRTSVYTTEPCFYRYRVATKTSDPGSCTLTSSWNSWSSTAASYFRIDTTETVGVGHYFMIEVDLMDVAHNKADATDCDYWQRPAE